MFKLPKKLSDIKIQSIVNDVNSIESSANNDDKWALVQPLKKGQAKQKIAALGLLELINKGHFSYEQSLLFPFLILLHERNMRRNWLKFMKVYPLPHGYAHANMIKLPTIVIAS